MPREVTRQADQHAQSPNVPKMDELAHDPHSAYGGGDSDPLFGEFGHDGYDYSDVSRGEFNHRMRDRDPREESEMARQDLLDDDEHSGYNWGPEPVHPGSVPPPPEEVDTHFDPDYLRGA